MDNYLPHGARGKRYFSSLPFWPEGPRGSSSPFQSRGTIFPSQPCCNPTFFFFFFFGCSTAPRSCRAECHPTHRCHTACSCLCLCLSVPAGGDRPFPSQRCSPSISKSDCHHRYPADMWADFFLQGCAERCWQQLPLSFVLLYRRRFSCGA